MVQKYDLPTKIQGSQFFIFLFFIQLTVPNPLHVGEPLMLMSVLPSVCSTLQDHFHLLATKKSTYK